jgi:hypothetical protein
VESRHVAVSRRISASAADIFQILADPKRHVDLDGSGMVRGSVTQTMVNGVGDVFIMKMYYSKLGDYEMNNHVVEYELNRRIGWEPESGRGHPDASTPDARCTMGATMDLRLVSDGRDATIVTESYDCSSLPEVERESIENGQIWIESMKRTLERLDELCTARSDDGRPQ